MNTQHTPAPWKVNENGWVIGANGETIVSHHPMTHLDETAQADARLIAAAPELLDALQTILALSTPVQTLPWEKAPVVNFAQHMDAIAAHARAAIAKATQP